MCSSISRRVCVYFVLLTSSLACACGGGEGASDSSTGASSESESAGDDAWTGADDAGTGSGSMDVHVEYEGAAMGGLTVAAFVSCPPEDPPLAFKRVSEPSYPVDVTLVNIEPGTYCAYAYIDEAPENPTFPGDEDPQAFVESVEVGTQPVSTILTVLDPLP